MATTLATVDAALKEFYLPAIREQLNSEVMLLTQLQKNYKDVEGRRAVLSLHVTRNSGVGARAEGGTLPTAGRQGYVEERVGMTHNYGRIQINGQVIRAMKSDTGSFTRAIDSESKGLLTDLKRDVNRQCYNGIEGTIAQCGTTGASTTVVLAAATGSSILRFLEVGMSIDIGTLAAPTTIASARSITAVDRANKTITISGAAVTTDNTHFITRAGTKSAAGSTNELIGLQAIVAASGTLFNVNPTTYPVWTSTVSSNGGTNRAATDNLFENVIDDVSLESGKAPNFALTTHGVVRNYAAQLKTQKRFTDTTELKGGFSALTVSAGSVTLPLVAERDCPNNKVFLLNLDHIFEHRMSDWEWMDEDGAVLSRVPNADAYEATMFIYHQLTTDQRNVHGLINDVTES
jgi:hypothetical protein